MNRNAASYAERERCPLYAALQAIDGRWKPMIFQRLGTGGMGFGELHRNMPGVTVKVLREQLRQLEAEGLVDRAAARPGHKVLFKLTPHGQTLGPVFERLWAWGVTHLERMKEHD